MQVRCWYCGCTTQSQWQVITLGAKKEQALYIYDRPLGPTYLNIDEFTGLLSLQYSIEQSSRWKIISGRSRPSITMIPRQATMNRLFTSSILVLKCLTWCPEGRRKVGRPRTTWRWTVEKERKMLGWRSWNDTKPIARDRCVGEEALQPYGPLGSKRIGEVRWLYGSSNSNLQFQYFIQFGFVCKLYTIES